MDKESNVCSNNEIVTNEQTRKNEENIWMSGKKFMKLFVQLLGVNSRFLSLGI